MFRSSSYTEAMFSNVDKNNHFLRFESLVVLVEMQRFRVDAMEMREIENKKSKMKNKHHWFSAIAI